MTMLFTEDHEWISTEQDGARLGITDYAQQQLGDVVFVELPTIGRVVKKGEAFAVVESVKAASEIYAPCDGTILAINSDLTENPSTINASPQRDGWLVKIGPSDSSQLAGLLDDQQYQHHIA